MVTFARIVLGAPLLLAAALTCASAPEAFAQASKPSAASVMSAPAEAFGKRFNAMANKAGFGIQFSAPACDGSDGSRTCRFSAANGLTATTYAASRGRGVSDIEVQATKYPPEGQEAGQRRAIEALSTMAMIVWPTRGKDWVRVVENIVSDAVSSGVRGAYKLDGVELALRIERSDAFMIFAR